MPRRSTLALSAAISGGVALASLVAATPAHAATATHQDETGDVAVITQGKAKYDTLDITQYKNTYANEKLTLKTTVVDLAASGWEIDWYVQGPDGVVHRAGVAGTDQGLQGLFLTSSGAACEGVTYSAKRNTVTLKVPFTCVDEAESLKIANYSIAPKGETKLVVDDANRGKIQQGELPQYADPLTYG